MTFGLFKSTSVDTFLGKIMKEAAAYLLSIFSVIALSVAAPQNKSSYERRRVDGEDFNTTVQGLHSV